MAVDQGGPDHGRLDRVSDSDAERLKDGIVRLLKTEIVELSLVTIPANRAATV